jgi:hypothetical protein
VEHGEDYIDAWIASRLRQNWAGFPFPFFRYEKVDNVIPFTIERSLYGFRRPDRDLVLPRPSAVKDRDIHFIQRRFQLQSVIVARSVKRLNKKPPGSSRERAALESYLEKA